MSGGVKPLETSLVEEMISLAIRQLSFSYTPYSGFKVGAALLAEDGTLYLFGASEEGAAAEIAEAITGGLAEAGQ